MADTPEKKVKKKVIEMLKARGAYYAMPVASGFGNAGVPDILACCNGRFVGIECKANGGKPTALQVSNLKQIENAGGVAMIVDEKSITTLNAVLERLYGEGDERGTMAGAS